MEIFRGRRLWAEKKEILLPSGSTRDKIIIHPGHAVAVLPLEGEHVKLLRQYRYAIGQYIIEAPAGTLEQDEDAETCARRELIEETGFAAKTIISRGFIWTTPGFTDEKIYLFEAHDLIPSSEFGKDDDEIIDVIDVPLHDLDAMILDGTISDAKTIALIHRCLR
ncbi:MAG TPA: NUDIX hydrolase [Methanoregulaceae archaeon]|nr:NUDIX hydrolase [Methanoregulaceae archaeon]HPD75627.1 NUDIX hydrolase [Methanoregulaceae archaeon]